MKYRREIDGLRALAVAPVIFFHAGLPFFSGGFVGVDIFFVISGYLITSILLAEKDAGTFSLRGFYERRARRILPALFVVMVVCAPAAYQLLLPSDLEAFARSVLATSLFSSNFLFWSESGYFDSSAELKPLLHTWSLAVEEQYYLLFPLLMMVGWRLRRRTLVLSLVVIAALSLGMAHWGATRNPSATFFLLPTRAWELLFGSLLAIYMAGGDKIRTRAGRELGGLMGLGMIGYAVFSFDKLTPFPSLYALVPVTGAALIILCATPQTSVGRLLALPPLVGMGLISYSAYLWHQPIFAFARYRSPDELDISEITILILATIALAYLTWKFVELAFRRRPGSPDTHTLRLSPKGSLEWLAPHANVTLMVSTVVVVALGGLLYASATVYRHSVPTYSKTSKMFGQEFADYVDRRNLRMPCDDSPSESRNFKACALGTDGESPELILWGDSLVGALNSGMNEALSTRKMAGMAFYVDACPPVLGMANPLAKQCDGNVHSQILEAILEVPGSQTVILHGNVHAAIHAGNIRINGLPASFDLTVRQIEEARAALRRSGKTLVLLEQGPIFSEDVAAHYFKQAPPNPVTELSVSTSNHVNSLEQLKRLEKNVDQYISTVDFFCNSQECPARDARGKIVVHDRNHVTKEYSLKLANHLLDRLRLSH